MATTKNKTIPQDIRRALETRWPDAEHFRLNQSGEVDAFGPMPNSGTIDWYYCGTLDGLRLELDQRGELA